MPQTVTFTLRDIQPDQPPPATAVRFSVADIDDPSEGRSMAGFGRNIASNAADLANAAGAAVRHPLDTAASVLHASMDRQRELFGLKQAPPDDPRSALTRAGDALYERPVDTALNLIPFAKPAAAATAGLRTSLAEIAAANAARVGKVVKAAGPAIGRIAVDAVIPPMARRVGEGVMRELKKAPAEAAVSEPVAAPTMPPSPPAAHVAPQAGPRETLDLRWDARTKGQQSPSWVSSDIGLAARRAKLVLSAAERTAARDLVKAGRTPTEAVVEASGQSAAAVLAQRLGTMSDAQMRAEIAARVGNRSPVRGSTPSRVPDDAPLRSLRVPASWVVVDKATGKAVMETFEESVVKKVNTSKYDVVPITEYLGKLNASVKAGR